MSDIFKKLNLKDQKEILVLNAPESFEPELAALEKVQIHRRLEGAQAVDFALAFVTRQAQVDELAGDLLPLCQGDAVIWFAYPKGSSKKYSCDFNRDTGWKQIEAAGFLPVRQVAIDEDWSALRFRSREYIKSLTRKW